MGWHRAVPGWAATSITIMPDLFLDDPCIVFALDRESQAFRQEFRVQQRFAEAPCWARFCGPEWLTVLVLHAGVGTARMTSAMEWLLGEPKFGNLVYRPRLILCAGFAGALREGLQVGAVVLATEVVDADGQRCPTTWPEELPSGEWRPPLRRGALLTARKLINTPEEKQALGKQLDCVAVDMESAAVARLCHKKNVPFGCVRVISDDVHTTLSPQLVPLMATGSVSIPRLLWTVVRSPGLVWELRRLARHTHLAGQHLGKALGELLTLTLPWSAELE